MKISNIVLGCVLSLVLNLNAVERAAPRRNLKLADAPARINDEYTVFFETVKKHYMAAVHAAEDEAKTVEVSDVETALKIKELFCDKILFAGDDATKAAAQHIPNQEFCDAFFEEEYALRD